MCQHSTQRVSFHSDCKLCSCSSFVHANKQALTCSISMLHAYKSHKQQSMDISTGPELTPVAHLICVSSGKKNSYFVLSLFQYTVIFRIILLQAFLLFQTSKDTQHFQNLQNKVKFMLSGVNSSNRKICWKSKYHCAFRSLNCSWFKAVTTISCKLLQDLTVLIFLCEVYPVHIYFSVMLTKFYQTSLDL